MDHQIRTRFIRTSLVIQFVIGLILAYIGLVQSSGEFLRLLWVLLFGIPGAIFMILPAWVLFWHKTSTKIIKYILATSLAYLLILGALTIPVIFTDNRRLNSYKNLYTKIQLGMTVKQVNDLTSGNLQTCTKPLEASVTACYWYQLNGSEYFVIYVDQKEKVIEKYRSNDPVVDK